MLSYEERAGEWRRRFDEQRASGLSVVAWCREHKIEKNTFYGWRKRLGTGSSVATPPQFIAVSVEHQPNAPASSLTLHIGRVAVEVASGFDPALLADVLNILESRAC